MKLRLREIKEVQDQVNSHVVMEKSQVCEFRKLVANGHLTDGRMTENDHQ